MASVPRGTRKTTWTSGAFELKVTTRSRAEAPSSLSCHSAAVVVAVIIVLVVPSSSSRRRYRRHAVVVVDVVIDVVADVVAVLRKLMLSRCCGGSLPLE